MYVKSIFSLYLYIQTARNYCPLTKLRYIETLGQANALVMDGAKYSECAPAAIEEPLALLLFGAQVIVDVE